MSDTFQATTDTNNKHIVESKITFATWRCTAAIGGSDAPIEVRTALVGDGAKIDIKGKSSKGKAPGSISGIVMQNSFIGNLPIPERVDPDAEIWFEAKLSKHGLSILSDRVPARPKFFIQTMEWDRDIVHRGEEVTMSVVFDSGIQEGQEAVVVVYEYSQDNNHDPLARFPVTIENNRVEVIWAFDYPGDVSQIPTHEELQPYGRSYAAPRYFFMLTVNGVTAGENQESGLLIFKDTIQLEAVQAHNMPLSNGTYKVTLSDGTVVEGSLDADGKATLEDVPPGRFNLTIRR